jgi:tRNA (adenine37-N6)-methyltransferase
MTLPTHSPVHGDTTVAYHDNSPILQDHSLPIATLISIGRIRTPYPDIGTCPGHGTADAPPTVLELNAEFEAALLGIESASHIYVLYWLHEANRNTLRRLTPHDRRIRGVFATRSPERPNPIGLSTARVIGIDGLNITVSGLDCIDGTPLIDIKAYVPRHDRIPDATVSWLP